MEVSVCPNIDYTLRCLEYIF